MASPVLIGLCDGRIDSRRHRSSFLTNKVGGEPDWPPLVTRQSPRCRRCGAPSAHVVQVYCPLEASPYHRTLHLFACSHTDCSGLPESWTVLRSQCSDDQVVAEAPTPQVAPLPPTDWCDSADDWGVEEGVETAVQIQEEVAVVEMRESHPVCEADVSCQLQHLNLEEPEDALAFCPFFISVVEESDLCGEDLDHAQELLKEYERREGVAVGGLEESNCSGEEKYEKTTAKHGDAVFLRFMKAISLCPQQILRYCRGGRPLFISKPPSNMTQLVSACSSCGGARTFELQLMPALVSLLQKKDDSARAELEFGTVLVYTCTNSCWTSGSGSALEEFCFVQADPDQQLFK